MPLSRILHAQARLPLHAASSEAESLPLEQPLSLAVPSSRVTLRSSFKESY